MWMITAWWVKRSTSVTTEDALVNVSCQSANGSRVETVDYGS